MRNIRTHENSPKLGDLVEGFAVDVRTPKPDCVACTKAKQEETSADKPTGQTSPGQLSHMDLVWGKYEVMSINGHQYFILFVDDATRYITVRFLRADGKSPRATRTDRGKVLINDALGTCPKRSGRKGQILMGIRNSSRGICTKSRIHGV